MDGLHDCRLASVLADQSASNHQSVAHISTRSGALLVGHASAHNSLGRKFSSRTRRHRKRECKFKHRCKSISTTRFRPYRRRRLCSQHLGAIIGALFVSLILIPWIGTQNSERILLLLSAVSAVIALVPYIMQRKSPDVAAWLTASLVLSGFLAWNVDAVPGRLIAYGRKMPLNINSSQVLDVVEGRNSSIAITQWSDGATEIDVNGHVEATTEIYDMKSQRMVGHLPALLHPNPKSILGIGFGAGVSAGTFTTYPGIEHITVCEIERQIPPTSTKYFAQQDYNVMNNPRTRIVYDDARHFVLTTPEKFDIIASDPLDVFVKGTAALYSKEYFDSVKAHLNRRIFQSLRASLRKR